MIGLVKIAGGMSMLSTMGIVFLAQVHTTPDNFESWPATAILGFIALASLSVIWFVVKNLFKAIDTLSGVKDQGQELCARMNVRPCLLKRDEQK